MQTQTPQTSALNRYLAAELDYVIANFSDTSTRFRRTLRRIAALSFLALATNRQNPEHTAAGRSLDKTLLSVKKEWPGITQWQLFAFVKWFEGAFEQFNLSEAELADLLLNV